MRMINVDIDNILGNESLDTVHFIHLSQHAGSVAKGNVRVEWSIRAVFH